jgi:hypothetical protein
VAKHCSHRIEFKRQVAREFLAGETLHGLAKSHDLARNFIRIFQVRVGSGLHVRLADWIPCTGRGFSSWHCRRRLLGELDVRQACGRLCGSLVPNAARLRP